MTKTKWVNESLVLCLLSLAAAASGCVAGAGSTGDGALGDEGQLPGQQPGDPSVEPVASPFPQPNRVPLPIVLLQGGLSLQGDILPLNYYFGVQNRLDDEGYQVFATQVDPLLGVAARAAQLAPQINAILSATGASRVHLIGHGQGGYDARYLVSSLGFGDRVATVTTIGTPHRGTLVADVSLGLVPGPIVNTLAFVTQLLGSGEADAVTNLSEMTTQYTATTFNPQNPADARISYYSIGGKTNVLTLDLFREDICNPLLLVGHLLLLGQGPNDGLVTVASSKYGEFLGVLPADNLDQVGQLLGLISLPFDHLAFYSELANFLTDESVANPL